MVKAQTQQTLIFAGTCAPAAHVKLKILGLPDNKTAEFSAALCGFLNTSLNIDDASNIYCIYNPGTTHAGLEQPNLLDLSGKSITQT